jgi:hypothetical protein
MRVASHTLICLAILLTVEAQADEIESRADAQSAVMQYLLGTGLGLKAEQSLRVSHKLSLAEDHDTLGKIGTQFWEVRLIQMSQVIDSLFWVRASDGLVAEEFSRRTIRALDGPVFDGSLSFAKECQVLKREPSTHACSWRCEFEGDEFLVHYSQRLSKQDGPRKSSVSLAEIAGFPRQTIGGRTWAVGAGMAVYEGPQLFVLVIFARELPADLLRRFLAGLSVNETRRIQK